VSEEFGTILGDKDYVFGADAELLIGEVDTRLERHDQPRLQRGVVVGRVMHIEADGVAEAVDEIGS